MCIYIHTYAYVRGTHTSLHTYTYVSHTHKYFIFIFCWCCFHQPASHSEHLQPNFVLLKTTMNNLKVNQIFYLSCNTTALRIKNGFTVSSSRLDEFVKPFFKGNKCELEILKVVMWSRNFKSNFAVWKICLCATKKISQSNTAPKIL